MWLTARLRMSSDLRLLILSNSSNSEFPRLVVLGIELDSLDQTACLPAEKLMALQELIQSWRTRRWCNRRQLKSLIGHLHHAAKVVWLGRIFLRRMLDLLCCFRTCDHPIRLSSEFRLDLQWWHDFLTSWHGVSLLLFPGMSAPTDVEVTSQHIPGVHNNIADALSRFHWQDFRRLAPTAQPHPVPIAPPTLGA